MKELPVTWVPVDSCTFPTADQPLRVAEFDVYSNTPTSAELVFRGGESLAAEIHDLAERETSCCSFFEFQIVASADSVTLSVRVPATQSAVLAGLVSRAEVTISA